MPLPENPHIKLVVSCAAPGCEKTKTDVNHWWIMIPNAGPHPEAMGILLLPWSDFVIRSLPHAIPLCGESCASKMISSWMSDVREEQQKCDSEFVPTLVQ